MAIQEFLNKLKVKNTDKLSAIEVEAQALKADVTEIELQETEYAAELKAAEEKGFEEGLAQAGQAGGEGKIYSDAEVNEMLAEKDAAFEAMVTSKDATIAEMQTQIDGHAALVETAKAEAVAAFKAELLAKYEEQQAQETASEAGIAELLK